jgi:hypothetical protein
MPGCGHAPFVFGVPQQDMQEFVNDDRLDLLVGMAVLLQERKIDQQSRLLLAGYSERRNGIGELQVENFQYSPYRKRILIDQFLQ